MDPEAQKRQRRGRRMMWILVGVMIALPIGGILYATFGPNPPIVISKATTHITAPLDADSLPDYAAAIRTHIQRDTTPDENGAIPFLEAMWPEQDEDSSPEDDRLVCTELGLPYPPPQNLRISSYDTKAMRLKALRHYRNRVTQVDFSSAPETETHEYEDVLLGYSMNEAAFWSANEDVAIDDERVNDLLYQALGKSWTADDLPFAAEWLDKNEVGFHLLVEATEKPRWYLPEAELLGPAGKRESLLGIAMSSLTQVSQAARYLAIQMGRSQGRGDYANAARYALGVLRLASHLSSEPYLVDHLVAVAIESVGIELVQRLAADVQTPRAVLVQLQEELKQIGRPNALARLDLVGERYFSLHEALRTSQYGIEPTDSEFTGIEWPLDSLQGLANGFAVDWNEVLIAINKQYDGIAAAIALPTRAQRLAALSAIDTRMTARSNRLGQRWREPRRFLSTKARGQLIADGYLADSFFSYANLASIDDRGQTSHDLTRLIIALAIYRVEQGVYPTSLNALKPNILSTLPVDPFNAKPYAYRRTDDGFLLYSLGQNGIDDGGSFASDGMGTMKYEGIAIDSMLDPSTDTLTPEEQAAYDLIKQIPAGADDVSLRVPLPVEPWPWEE